MKSGENNMKRTIVVGSRQSHLALTQTGHVIEQLRRICERLGLDYDFQIKKIVTRGDQILDVTLSKVGGKGLFVKEIEQALLDGAIDMAVHSMKDMPSQFPDGLIHAATPKREDPRDALISMDGVKLDKLPFGAKIGTSSLRRGAQLKAYRNDLQIESIRGNIETRLRKLETEGFAAIVLAAAGLHRVGWEERISEYLSPDICLPAVGQGALGIECRENDEDMIALLAHLNDEKTDFAVRAERSFLARLNGGCQVPIGAHGVLREDGTKREVQLTGFVGSPDGNVSLKETLSGDEPELVGNRLAEQLIARGADQILEQARG